MPQRLVPTTAIKVGGRDLDTLAVRALRTVRVEMSMWVPNRCTIRFVDPDFELTDANTFAVGKELTVALPSGDSDARTDVFAGEITDVAVEQGGSGRHELVVGGLDKSHRLAVATNVVSYANKTWKDIVSSIATTSGLTPDVAIGGDTLEYVLQTTSDYAFLWEAALRTGSEWWVDGGKLHFKARAATAGPTLAYGKELSDFRVRYSGTTHPNKVTVQGWSNSTQAAIKGEDTSSLTGSSIPAIGSSATFATDNRTASAAAWGKGIVAGGIAVKDAAEAKAVAGAIAARVDAAEVLARGVCFINPAVKVGQVVTIADMGTRVSGDYLVTSVEHVVSPDRVETRFTAGNKAPVELADLVGAGVGAGGGASGPARWSELGLVVGTVTAVTDDPDKAGRVKVKFPSLSAQDTSAWARVLAPGAGKETGLQFGPEVNDEVLVGFEHGDHRFPVVLGGLWSKVNVPPVATAANPVVSRLIKSRLGHTLELGDGAGDDKKHIEMKLADGQNKIRLGADKTDIEVASGKVFTIKSGSATIKIDGQGGVSIEGGAVKITATQDLTLKGVNVKINADAGVTIAANAQFKATGNAGATLDAGGAIAMVKGSMVKIN